MLPNCKIQIFKTFKRMRLLPKKENTQKNLHTENIAHDPLPSSAKPKSSIPQTFFGRQTVVLPKKFSFFFNCASRRLLRRRRNSIKTNKSKIASFSSASLNVVFIILNTKVRLPSPLPSCRFSLGRRRRRRR